jgi:hypothetical protein
VSRPVTVLGRRATVAAAVLAGVLLAPALVATRYDSFPLSTYPMFAGDRDRVAPVSTVVAVSGEGTERLSSHLIGGSDEPMLAAETVVHAIRDGTTDELCREVAQRAVGSELSGRTLEVVTELYDSRAWFDGEREPVDRTVFAECTVPR